MCQQEIGLRLEQLRRVLVTGVSVRIMQHEGIQRLRYSLARKSVTPGTFYRETQPGRVPFNRRRLYNRKPQMLSSPDTRGILI